MQRKHINLIAIAAVLLIVLGAIAYLFLSKDAVTQTTVAKAPTTTRRSAKLAATGRAKVLLPVSVPELVSPADIKPSPDARIRNLIDQYNKTQDQIAASDLHGACT